MRLACQIAWVAWMGIGFLASVYWAINGRKEREATGFVGVLFAIIVYAASISLGFGAGVYQGFFR